MRIGYTLGVSREEGNIVYSEYFWIIEFPYSILTSNQKYCRPTLGFLAKFWALLCEGKHERGSVLLRTRPL